MGIIDFRFRPNTAEVVNGIKNSAMFKDLCGAIGFDRMKAQTLDEIIAGLRENGVERAVITGRDSETTYGSASNNPSVEAYIRACPEMFVGFWGIDPHKGMAGVRSLTEAVTRCGFKGAAIDPYLAKIPASEARYYPFYSKCCELGIPVVVTTGPASFVPGAVIEHVAPRHMDTVARDFPDLRIVISHGAYPWVGEMIIVAQRNRNVFLEISEYERFPQSEAYVQAANTIIPDKLLFASAHPFVDYREAIATYHSLPFTDAVRRKVMHDNAAALLATLP
ncbi:amidohydrolase family protein [Desulfovibrio aminophilus]|uniref:amidohydrolase family protein n=1 Tax=Desulfovibrio aminophilus TaxID=81425 RepID=UPI0033920C29